MKISQKKLFLFDFDGVVVDSLELYEKAVNHCLKVIGASPLKGRQGFLDIFDENFYEGIRKKGVDVEAFMKVSQAIAPTLNYEQVKPVEGMAPVIGKLRRNHTIVIVSSNSAQVINHILSLFGLDLYFAEILGLEFMLSKIGKIRHALCHFQADPRNTYYVGDTAGDIGEAKEAGVRTIAVTWGWHTKEKLALTSPDFILDSPEELLRI